jgi:putative peptide zinc metalloprotease protein
MSALAPLREDLELRRGGSSGGTGDSWLIYDPLRHRYIQIDAPTFAILSLWKRHTTLEALCSAVSAKLGVAITRRDVEGLTRFLDTHQLTDRIAAGGWRGQMVGTGQHKHSLLMWAVHNYLFLKIPLICPEPFLRVTAPWVSIVYTKTVQRIILCIGLLGLYLATREWDRFAAEAQDLASISGLAEIAVVLFAIKGLHELGHAYTALRYGCRVPSIGIAFMMLAPLLYTDVTDAWRLQDRNKRLTIDAAGIAVEIGVACLATFAWAFMADGLVKHVAFLVATTSWVMSVAVNLNPFMRFDGYYIASDLLRVENLQSRSFALGVWHLRETLFGLKVPCPELMPGRLKATLVAYAYGIWIYRLFLFTGIAVLVYGHVFKLLGVCLFLFEIVYFIARPILGELITWWTMRRQILAKTRFLIPVALLAAMVGLAILPWSTQVSIPAVLEGSDPIRIYPLRAGRIAALSARVGQRVSAGDMLVSLTSPDLEHERAIALAQRNAVTLRLNRQSADREDLDLRQVLESQRLAMDEKLTGLDQQLRDLEVRAEADGVVAEINPNLNVGQWIGAKEEIALLDASKATRAMGYVPEDDLWRLQTGRKGRFIPEDPLAQPLDLTLTDIAVTSSNAIDLTELAAPNGGKIDVHPDGRRGLIPTAAQFLVTMSVSGATGPPPTRTTGTVILTADPESWLSGTWRHILKVLVRESGN